MQDRIERDDEEPEETDWDLKADQMYERADDERDFRETFRGEPNNQQ